MPLGIMCIAVNSLEANADNTLTAYKLKTFIIRLQCLNIVENSKCQSIL